MEVEGGKHSLEVALWPPRLWLFIADCIKSCTVTMLEDVTMLGSLYSFVLLTLRPYTKQLSGNSVFCNQVAQQATVQYTQVTVVYNSQLDSCQHGSGSYYCCSHSVQKEEKADAEKRKTISMVEDKQKASTRETWPFLIESDYINQLFPQRQPF